MSTTAAKAKKKVTKKTAPLKKAAKKAAATKPESTKSDQTSVGVRELRQSASRILDQVKAGTIIEVTEHGVPVARLVPIVKSLYEEYVAAGLIIPAENPDWRPTSQPIKVKGNKSSTQVLMEMRAEERY